MRLDDDAAKSQLMHGFGIRVVHKLGLVLLATRLDPVLLEETFCDPLRL